MATTINRQQQQLQTGRTNLTRPPNETIDAAARARTRHPPVQVLGVSVPVYGLPFLSWRPTVTIPVAKTETIPFRCTRPFASATTTRPLGPLTARLLLNPPNPNPKAAQESTTTIIWV
jgi:hypothetical protein